MLVWVRCGTVQKATADTSNHRRFTLSWAGITTECRKVSWYGLAFSDSELGWQQVAPAYRICTMRHCETSSPWTTSCNPLHNLMSVDFMLPTRCHKHRNLSSLSKGQGESQFKHFLIPESKSAQMLKLSAILQCTEYQWYLHSHTLSTRHRRFSSIRFFPQR